MMTYGAVDCPNYIPSGTKKTKTTVVIGPVRLIKLPNKKNDAREFTDIIVGCNMFLSCLNVDCTYSKASRDARRLKKENAQPT